MGQQQHPPYPPVQRVATDTPAVIALVLGVCGLFTGGLTSVVGIVVGHVTRRGTPTQGLSTAAIVVSWVVTVVWAVGWAFFFLVPFLALVGVLASS
ncbi:DUF4190 domain-containing protein [Kineococcus auxinigenes]|uniref:DUF4190 domain-containing protein n=1 Tax=unclassified Kineococcus TaxID=2621656 RepID=UPI003D7C8824